MAFDHQRIASFLAVAGERLDGDWLLAGGGAAIAWFASGRSTEDLDLIALDHGNAQRLALMELAEAQALPVEALNSTVDYFIRRIADWREHLVVLHRGSRATVFRPDATLFLLLKIRRLSESDLADCVALVDHCARTGDTFDRARIVAELDERPRANVLRDRIARQGSSI